MLVARLCGVATARRLCTTSFRLSRAITGFFLVCSGASTLHSVCKRSYATASLLSCQTQDSSSLENLLALTDSFSSYMSIDTQPYVFISSDCRILVVCCGTITVSSFGSVTRYHAEF